jgi:glycosyltransferase involved in cell wall biosynthesis
MSSEVSGLIPAHGPSPYIKYTLESIAKNTIQPDEVLIVDDGISKEAIDLINLFSQSLPIVVIPNEGKGLVDALNTGLQNAKGKYIARIDNDDLMTEYRIERQLAQFESDPNFVAVGSQCFYIDSDGTRTGRSNYLIGSLNQVPNFKSRCLIAHPSTMYLRDSALAIGGYRSVFSWNGVDIAEDFDFWLRLSKKGLISVSDEVLTEYRQHADQLSSRHLAGQQIGTPYISSIHVENMSNPIKIRFENGQSDQDAIFLKLIRNNLGFKNYLAARLSLYIFKETRFSSSTFIKRLISKFISLLQY